MKTKFLLFWRLMRNMASRDGVVMRAVGLFLLLGILALTMHLRLADLGQPPLWGDEQSSMLVALGQTVKLPYDANSVTPSLMLQPTEPDLANLYTGFTPGDVWSKDRIGNVLAATQQFDHGNGIIFNFLCHEWILLVGLDDVHLKLLSVLLGTATVAILFVGLRAAGLGLLGATCVGLVMAVHPLLIWSSRELRPYALATLLAVLATMLLLRLVQLYEQGRPWAVTAVVYALAMAGTLLTHYESTYIFIGHGFWALLCLRRRAWTVLLLSGGAGVGIFAVWLATAGFDGLKIMSAHEQLWAQRAQTGRYDWLQPITPDRLRDGMLGNFVQYLMLQPMWLYQQKFKQLVPGDHAEAIGWAGLGSLLGALAGASVWAARRHQNGMARLRLLLLILAGIGPLMAGALALRAGHTLPFIFRYQSFSAPFAAALLGLCAAELAMVTKWTWFKIMAVLPLEALAVAMLLAYFGSPDRFGLPPDPRGNLYYKAASDIAAMAQADDVVIYREPYDAVLISLYLKDWPDLHSIVEKSDMPGRAAVLLRRNGTDILIAAQPF